MLFIICWRLLSFLFFYLLFDGAFFRLSRFRLRISWLLRRNRCWQRITGRVIQEVENVGLVLCLLLLLLEFFPDGFVFRYLFSSCLTKSFEDGAVIDVIFTVVSLDLIFDLVFIFAVHTVGVSSGTCIQSNIVKSLHEAVHAQICLTTSLSLDI